MFRNLTPHDIRLRIDESNEAIPLETDIVYLKDPLTLRIDETVVSEIIVDNIRIRLVDLGEIIGLPEYIEGTYLIVSMPTAIQAWKIGRRDVVAPDTSEDAIRFTLPNGQNGTYAVRSFRFLRT